MSITPTEEERVELLNLFKAWQRLKDLGWKEAMYAPRSNRRLHVIEMGSTGIHPGERDSMGRFWAYDVETYPANPILYREAP